MLIVVYYWDLCPRRPFRMIYSLARQLVLDYFAS